VRQGFGMRARAESRAIRAILAAFLLGWMSLLSVRAALPVAEAAAPPSRPARPGKSASIWLRVPRFVSLVSGDLNMQFEPGFQYPIEIARLHFRSLE